MSWQNRLVIVALGALAAIVIYNLVKRHICRRRQSNNVLSVAEYAAGTSPIDIALGELRKVGEFFERRRSEAKYKAENVLVATRVANGSIAVIGVLVTFEGWSRWGLVSTALAALVAGIAEWDAHYRHRELWIQRTIILSKLQNLLRDAQFQLARGIRHPDDIADGVMARLAQILDEDLRNWTAMRGDTEDPEKADSSAAANAQSPTAAPDDRDAASEPGTVPEEDHQK
ncbi:SLATT domain-containing protein [Mycolicibacterium fortuitum]|uniref:SLATT domain-containing protein n=1 Tax=Mycolicibacterium fortuitum TaxID=1766 RepID=UPI0015E868DB|nr:SLATT domain-containing protein [Mycolicibacterium fortuitum]WAY19208.1 SLATT domain-containing protein [Mycolicibacterium fortuitum]